MDGPRHSSWDRLCNLIEDISRKYGGTIYDSRANQSWDPGQAVCAELYGPDWSNSPGFKKSSNLPDSIPAPLGAIEAAQRLLAGDCEWGGARVGQRNGGGGVARHANHSG